MFDFCFSENGLTAFRLGQSLPSNSFIQWLGEEKYQKLAKFCLRYISNLEGLPAMRGTFIEFRNGMVNVSPVGRNASNEERNEFEKWDRENKCRGKMIAAIGKEFPDIGLTYVPPCEGHQSQWPFLRTDSGEIQILNRRPNLIRLLPHWLGQDLLSTTHRS